jgi:hypothetical protein
VVVTRSPATTVVRSWAVCAASSAKGPGMYMSDILAGVLTARHEQESPRIRRIRERRNARLVRWQVREQVLLEAG